MTYQTAYRVMAIDQEGKIESDLYLYSEKLAQIQFGILLKEQQYHSCKIVLYNPHGKLVATRGKVVATRGPKRG